MIRPNELLHPTIDEIRIAEHSHKQTADTFDHLSVFAGFVGPAQMNPTFKAAYCFIRGFSEDNLGLHNIRRHGSKQYACARPVSGVIRSFVLHVAAQELV